MNYVKLFLLSFVFCLLFSCGRTTLVDPGDIPSTENGTVAAGNRFFFIGGNTLYELLRNSDGSCEYQEVLKRNDCMFTGLTSDRSTLYAACAAYGQATPEERETGVLPTVWSDLVRVDLHKDESDPLRLATTRLEGPRFFLNGMAVDCRGDIFISNSNSRNLARATGEINPALIRVRVVDEGSFTVEKTPVISMEQGGTFPNGVQIKGGRLWLMSGNVIYATEIRKDGLSEIENIYSVASCRMLDDFAVLPNSILAVTEIPFPGAAGADTSGPSKLNFVSTGSGPDAAELVWEYEFDSRITPSSATYIVDREGPALYVTDFFSGGLYRVGVDQQ